MAAPIPIYTPANCSRPAYHLRYAWTGWPSAAFPPRPQSQQFWKALDAAWESDGLRRLEGTWKPNAIQFTFSAKPRVPPVAFVARVKGRLQHALRQLNTPTRFSRKVAFRTIGDNTRDRIEAYIRGQVDREPFADARFAERLKQFSVSNANARLDLPTATLSGRYWYNLHLVLVTAFRSRLVDIASLTAVRDGCERIAAKRGHRLGELSVLPDHVHMALRPDISMSPLEVALEFLNNLAYRFGQNAMFQHGYYVGSFGEYDMNAVRAR